MERLGLRVSSLPDRMSHRPCPKKYLVFPADMERSVEKVAKELGKLRCQPGWSVSLC